MKVSRTTIYAIQATLELAQSKSNEPISSRELASRGKMPERFLVQVLRSLVSSGILHSVQGVSGGYYLARAPDQITLLSIWESFDNSKTPTIPEVNGLSAAKYRRLSDALATMWEAARLELDKLTIADLA